jgi:hypothetical protein
VEVVREKSGCSREEEFQFWLLLGLGRSECIGIVVFDGVSPSVTKVLHDFANEARLWCLAGASGLRAI